MAIQTGTLGSEAPSAALLAHCLECASALAGREVCPGCGRSYPVENGLLSAIGPLTGTNRIAAAFYDGSDWQRFRPWERLFLWFQGGAKRARWSILRHLPQQSPARVLEVGIGDGENLPWLPPGWEIYGVDISRVQLSACRDRFASMSERLIWAEAEALPFADKSFDAAYSVGGFTYFRDQRAALRELRRVTREGGPVVVADEVPNLHRYGPGSVLGWERLDRWALSRMGLNQDFLDMVFNHTIDLDALAREEWPRHRRFPIWSRLGYCFVDPDPTTA
jgi:SAM-dependent methyltransferase